MSIHVSPNQDYKIQIDLTGPEGNAYYLLGVADKLANQLGLDGDKIQKEMKSGSYDNLIDVFDEYFCEYVELNGDDSPVEDYCC